MAAIYILYSEKLAKYYTGSCQDLSNRLLEHHNKTFAESYTSNSDDWTLCFSEEGLGYNQARKIEQHIKKMKSKLYIENLMKYKEIIERLKEKYN
jgi:putative endonuclease